jgi:hypothetical protein
MKNLWFILVIFGLLFLFGCPILKTKCTQTTDCGADELCREGYCEGLPACRGESETCDTTSDCCDEFLCEENYCITKACPADCSDRNDCTTDFCDFSTGFTCQHDVILSCCGNNICEANENCETCPSDCSCTKDELCAEGECTSAYEYELDQIDLNYNLSMCFDEVFLLWDQEDHPGVKEKIIVCRERVISYRNDLNGLQSRYTTENQTTQSAVRLYALEAMDSLWAYFYESTKMIEKMESAEEYSDEEYLSDLKSMLSKLTDSMHYLYLIKTEYPGEWGEEQEETFDALAVAYELNNQALNEYYDALGDTYYKYAFQVDPLDSVIIELTDELTEGLTDEAEIKLVLLSYVQENVEYDHDPSWQTDWVQLPAYTFMTGKGDCDDHAVLLASMFHRAGVSGVELCFADTDYDGYNDHLTVGISGQYIRYIYESTWDDETEPIPEAEYDGWVDCYNVEEVVEYAEAPKCSDGTRYGYCSDYSAGYYCTDELELVSYCSHCGCSEEYPYCAEQGPDIGECYDCPFGSTAFEGDICCKTGYSAWGNWGTSTGMYCCPPGYVGFEGGNCCLTGYTSWGSGSSAYCCPPGYTGFGDGHCCPNGYTSWGSGRNAFCCPPGYDGYEGGICLP